MFQEREERNRERERAKNVQAEMTSQYQSQFDTLKKQNRSLVQRLQDMEQELQEAIKTGESISIDSDKISTFKFKK